MLPEPKIPIKPPGPQRTYSPPSSSGRIPFKSNHAGVDSETAYWIWGDLTSGKTPLILLHGGPGVTHGYMVPFSLLNNDYSIPVIAYDQIGCGASTRFRDRKGDVAFWTPELFVEELDNLDAWLKSEWNVTQFDVLGHSWGGKLAAVFALRSQPAGLRKLIICNANTDTNSLVANKTRLRTRMPEAIQDVFRRQANGAQVSAEDIAHARSYEGRLHACRIDPQPDELLGAHAALREDDTVFSTMMGAKMDGTMARMKGLLDGRMSGITSETCPGGILMVSGQHDTTDDSAMVQYYLEPKCTVKWIRLPLSSHFVMFEEPEALLKVVGSFLTMVP